MPGPTCARGREAGGASARSIRTPVSTASPAQRPAFSASTTSRSSASCHSYNWTPERLWAAYEALEASRVRGSAGKQFTNLISLVHKALDPDRDLVAYPLTVDERFQNWLAQQTQAGTEFTDEQIVWLTRIKDHLATSLTITPDDFELEPFVGHGGFGRANAAFAGQLAPLLEELSQELVA